MLILLTAGACGNKNIQGLPVAKGTCSAERVNYEFVKATTLTDEFLCVSFIIPTLHTLFIREKQELRKQVIIDFLLFVLTLKG
jgi:hypothetical protein